MTEGSEDIGIAEFVADDLSSFMTAVLSASAHLGHFEPWWRGQRNASWSLVPGVYRLGLQTDERSINNRFCLMAKSRRGEVPERQDNMGWLFLMQHYRLPTRLLDWSQSPLVALYFSTETPDDSDAMLWAMRPMKLNRLEANEACIYVPSNSELNRLGRQAFSEIRDVADDNRILAVLTEESDPRHMVQQSAFTIHGRSDPLEERGDANTFLARIRIPAAAKGRLRLCLRTLGITRASLFPDLENLALELASLKYRSDTDTALQEIADKLTISG